MQSSIDIVDHNIKTINTWLKDISEELDLIGEEEAWLRLKAVLQTLRDRITVDEAADFAAQLPIIVRGLYFEGWHPAETPHKWRDRAEYMEAFSRKLKDEGDGERTLKAVLRVLDRHLDSNELNRVKEMHPKELWDLWPG
ncbi:DUF2267 domain-containing protein [Marinobacter orientalis]|uniref:DUF2267 domain-containing protein n=1 Tax=Marinobacter orientalis TaxID=1928859 RepID=A0A7Y0WTL9_9GAMM|nr:DUF2267 domain-containing protein [Marinobacter orientalis]NMT65123.1 DUF2267 domain-containing protein [Marinobacter orientalis]TGX48932.1 DUF2267 domain-containing protein [Marinobacter orientalis]